MILEIQSWYFSFSQILSDCRGGASEDNCDNNNNNNNSAVLLVCSPNVDALATAWILAYMLRNYGVSYQLSVWKKKQQQHFGPSS